MDAADISQFKSRDCEHFIDENDSLVKFIAPATLLLVSYIHVSQLNDFQIFNLFKCNAEPYIMLFVTTMYCIVLYCNVMYCIAISGRSKQLG